MNEQIKKELKRKLGQKRYAHTIGVAECAEKLAEKYGANPEKAYTAGLLHDIVKEDTVEQMLLLCENTDIDAEMCETRALLHGPAGAEYAKKHFDIDEDVYNACFYHTVGRENMSVLEKIVYLADVIEPNRTQPGVEALRTLAETDLNQAVLQAMNNTIGYLEENHMKVHKNSLNARNFLLKSL